MKKGAKSRLPDKIDLVDLERKIGRKIRERRQELGMTQQDLADKLGLSYQQIQKYETGLNRISAGRLFLVAKFLFTDLNYFFEAPIPKEEISKRRPTMLALSNTGIDPSVQIALANLVQALSRKPN